jgi:hypothetical protein
VPWRLGGKKMLFGVGSYNEGQTLIDEDEKEDLIVITTSTRGELYEFEKINI